MTSKNTSPAAGDDGARKQSDLGGSNCFQNNQPHEPTQARPSQHPPIPLTDVWLDWPVDGGAA